MKYEKILFHTHFREMAFNSLEALLALQRVGLRQVVLVHVIARDDVAFVPYGGYLKEQEDHIREMAHDHFSEWRKILAGRGIDSKIRIQCGVLNAEILSVAEEETVDLIVVGRKKRTAFERVYVGAHILDILRRSAIPVLMSKYMAQFESDGETITRVNDQIFKRPMLATDWSAPSEDALDALIALNGLSEKLLIAHNVGKRTTREASEAGLKRIEKDSRQRLEAYCRRVEKAGLQAEAHLSFGRTVKEILRMSREYGASMIALGRTGNDWFHEYWLGGVSHRVAELSELPVLLVS